MTNIITIKTEKNVTKQERADMIGGLSGLTMSAFLSNKDEIAYIFPRLNIEKIEAPEALERLQAIFQSHNVGTGKGSYNLSSWSIRKALGKDQKILKIGIGRRDKKTENKNNSRSVTFKNKVIPALASLEYIAGASLRKGKAKDGTKTYSIMVFPIIGAII